MENEPRMNEGAGLESETGEYRIVLRRNAATHTDTSPEDVRTEEQEPADEDILWSDTHVSLDALSLWESAGLVPTVAQDMYELQVRDDAGIWQFVALFGNEEDLEEALDEARTSPVVLLKGEDESL